VPYWTALGSLWVKYRDSGAVEKVVLGFEQISFPRRQKSMTH